MSARPVVPRLDPEDLDLLISRSLDGDLPAEDEQKLQDILTADPEAARRRAELAGVVASLNALPNHEPPFAIATRVNVQVADRVKGLGSTWHRFGLYPPPGLVGAAIAVLVGVGLASAFFTTPSPVKVASAPPQPARKAGGRVEVFFQEKDKDVAASNAAAPAAAPAPEPKTMIAELQDRRQKAQQPSSRLDAPAEKRAADREQAAGFGARSNENAEKNALKKDVGRAGVVAGAVGGSLSAPAATEADASIATSHAAKESTIREGAKEEAQSLDQKVEQKQAGGKLKAAEAPRDELAANAPAGAPAQIAAESRPVPAAPAMRLRAQVPAPKPRWSVAIVGPAQIGASWRLKKTPTTAPPDRPVTVVYRLTLDRAGRVLTAKTESGGVPAEVDEMVRGLLFEPSGEGDSREVEVEITAR